MKKLQVCPDRNFSSSKMIIFITGGQILEHRWIGVLCSKSLNVWHQGTFTFRSCESVWTCREAQGLYGLVHERSVLKNIQQSIFSIQKPLQVAHIRIWAWALGHGALFKGQRGRWKSLWKACPNFSCWAVLFKVLLWS